MAGLPPSVFCSQSDTSTDSAPPSECPVTFSVSGPLSADSHAASVCPAPGSPSQGTSDCTFSSATCAASEIFVSPGGLPYFQSRSTMTVPSSTSQSYHESKSVPAMQMA